MPKRTSYKRISKRAKLLLELEESLDIEFKRNANNLKGEDFASFANSEFGGTILIGVDEIKDSKGRQRTEIVGCPIGDEPKRALNSKAQQCSPPVEIEIFIENESRKPFYRVEIPSGKNKPYCSSGGTYKIRRDGQKESLLPQDLLRIFMTEESGKFLQKFKESTLELRRELQDQNNDLINSIIRSTSETESNIQYMLFEMENRFQDVSNELKQTEEEISSSLEVIQDENERNNEIQDDEQTRIQRELNSANDNIVRLAWKLNALLDRFEIEDPEITFKRNEIKDMLSITKGIFEGQKRKRVNNEIEELYERYSRNRIVREFFSLEDFKKWYKEVTPSESMKNLAEEIKKPKKK